MLSGPRLRLGRGRVDREASRPILRPAPALRPGTPSPQSARADALARTSAGTGHQLLGAAEVPDPPVGTRILEPLSL